MAIDLVALFQHLGLRPGTVHLVAHDFGASLGWLLAGGQPGWLRSYCAMSVGHANAFFGQLDLEHVRSQWNLFAADPGWPARGHGRPTTDLPGRCLPVRLASLLCALAPSLEVLVAVRFLQGAAAAMTLPSGLGIVLAASPPSGAQRRSAYGLRQPPSPRSSVRRSGACSSMRSDGGRCS